MVSISLSCSSSFEIREETALELLQGPHIKGAIIFRDHGLDYGSCRMLTVFMPSFYLFVCLFLAMLSSDIFYF